MIFLMILTRINNSKETQIVYWDLRRIAMEYSDGIQVDAMWQV